MFRCYNYTTIRERINLFVLKLQLLKYSIKVLPDDGVIVTLKRMGALLM